MTGDHAYSNVLACFRKIVTGLEHNSIHLEARLADRLQLRVMPCCRHSHALEAGIHVLANAQNICLRRWPLHVPCTHVNVVLRTIPHISHEPHAACTRVYGRMDTTKYLRVDEFDYTKDDTRALRDAIVLQLVAQEQPILTTTTASPDRVYTSSEPAANVDELMTALGLAAKVEGGVEGEGGYALDSTRHTHVMTTLTIV